MQSFSRLQLAQEHREDYECLGDVVILLDKNMQIAENFDLKKYVCVHKKYLVKGQKLNKWDTRHTFIHAHDTQMLWKIGRANEINLQGGVQSGLFKAGVDHSDRRYGREPECDPMFWCPPIDKEGARDFTPYLLNGVHPMVKQSWLPPGERHDKEQLNEIF